ncbi:RNA polymerase sigma factor [Pedobacter sp. P26]|uniref:RNA polymerase sigma factor n=1 Tax=Pedobacter sp. P26 TaxID=3423956 RepID=UPI003D679A5E
MKKLNGYTYTGLLADIASGNQAAFSKLYDLFYPALIRHVVSKINDETAAQDILHDLFLSLWKSRERLSQIESLPAYLYASCRYLIIQHLRKLSLVDKYEDIQSLEIASKEQPLEDRLYYRYLLDKVNQEIDNLPEKCRAIFKMSRNDYMSNKEIAEIPSNFRINRRKSN